jgi:hypothetical protein
MMLRNGCTLSFLPFGSGVAVIEKNLKPKTAMEGCRKDDRLMGMEYKDEGYMEVWCRKRNQVTNDRQSVSCGLDEK